MKVCWKSQSRLFPCQFVTSKFTLFYFFIIYTRIVQIKHTFIIWGASFKLVFTPFYASMHWTIEPPVCASSRGRAVQREGRISLHLIFTDLISILLLFINNCFVFLILRSNLHSSCYQEAVNNKRLLSASDGGVDHNLHGNNPSTGTFVLGTFFVQIKILCKNPKLLFFSYHLQAQESVTQLKIQPKQFKVTMCSDIKYEKYETLQLTEWQKFWMVTDF